MGEADSSHLNKKLSLAEHSDFQSKWLEDKRFLWLTRRKGKLKKGLNGAAFRAALAHAVKAC
jgi:hypothetical protein